MIMSLFFDVSIFMLLSPCYIIFLWFITLSSVFFLSSLILFLLFIVYADVVQVLFLFYYFPKSFKSKYISITFLINIGLHFFIYIRNTLLQNVCAL